MDIGRKKLRLGDVLINSGTIIPEQLEEALNAQKGTGKKLGQVLVEKGYVNEDDIAEINRIVELLEQRKRDKKNPVKRLIRFFKG